MKKLFITYLCFVALALQAQTPQSFSKYTPEQQQKLLEMAKVGCQKPLGIFPTPSKLACALTALNLPQDTKAKELALIFNACHGRVLKADTSGITPKAYGTLGECLKDPAAINLINKEIQAHGFVLPTHPDGTVGLKVVNPDVLGGVPIPTSKMQ